MCEHSTAIVLDEWGAVSVMRCTWECGIVYFTTTNKTGLTYQVSYEKALGMQPKREILPFTDTSATPEDDNAAYHGQVDAV